MVAYLQATRQSLCTLALLLVWAFWRKMVGRMRLTFGRSVGKHSLINSARRVRDRVRQAGRWTRRIPALELNPCKNLMEKLRRQNCSSAIPPQPITLKGLFTSATFCLDWPSIKHQQCDELRHKIALVRAKPGSPTRPPTPLLPAMRLSPVRHPPGPQSVRESTTAGLPSAQGSPTTPRR